MAVGIVGAACRLPQASNEAELKALLAGGVCAITPFPRDRWDVARHLHPAQNVPGFSYTFAGGFLDTPYAFDPSAFGLSPRESEQMDPQQRLLLEVVWEALENAQIPPSSLAREEVGVYVGASSLDHGNVHASDPASIGSHFMTGNTLSIVSNRLSYIFDWRGPSFTVDTACSSSLVALAQAFRDLKSGRIDTAMVAGVNVLLSPFSYVGFSRASMLSPTGLCRPFSASGDGYVRSEGAVAFVLRRADVARVGSIRALIEAADVNSDGRTSGIALPGIEGQVSLLERVWNDCGFTPDDLAFVEAHGTGTRVGDPIEAEALGRVLGRRRSRPLPIGSVKSNIGHLEPASGVAGLMKALIALETRVFPQSLHLEEIHPDIDFESLNLAPAHRAVTLAPEPEKLVCGVSSFGFGGTNAHVVLSSAPRVPVDTRPETADRLVISAATRDALRATATAYADRLSADVDADRLAAAVARGRDLLKHRAVVELHCEADAIEALRACAEGRRHVDLEEGAAPARDAKICFVYSGNGAQWVGMGRTAHTRNAAFRARFAEIDAVFARLEDRSLVADLFCEDLAERMRFGAFVQPLIFAIQASITAALAEAGVKPDFVLGHSVGELAAADACGAITLEDALRIVRARSSCQEAVHGRGLMAVLAAGREAVVALLEELGRDDIEIAAENGPNSITLSGSAEGIRLATREARRRRMAGRALDIEYPFHSSFLDGLSEPMLADLGTIVPAEPRVPLISTVTGEPVGRDDLGPGHWWRNVRMPVLFRTAVEKAAGLGAQLFIEIGPKPILVSPIVDTLREAGENAGVVHTLAEADDKFPRVDPIARIVARAVANGATVAQDRSTPPLLDRNIDLPTYCWNRREYRFAQTSEKLDVFGDQPSHPLIGTRLGQGRHEWHKLLDARVVPYLADHVVDDEVVVPGAALAEMILAVGRELQAEGPIAFEDLDLLIPLILPNDGMREISIRHVGATGVVEIWSRPRLGPDEWSLHARARLSPSARARRVPSAVAEPEARFDAATIYARATASGIDYGPAFRLALGAVKNSTTMDVVLAAPVEPGTGHHEKPQLLHPASFDAALHPLFCMVKDDPREKTTHLPMRIGRMVLHRDHAVPTSARLFIERETKRSLSVAIWLFDEEGACVAELSGVYLRAVVLEYRDTEDSCFHVAWRRRARAAAFDAPALVESVFAALPKRDADEGYLILRAHMLGVAHRSLSRFVDADRRFDLASAVASGKIAATATATAASLCESLVAADLATRRDGVVVLAAETGLPPPERILATFAAEFSGSVAPLLLAARTAAEIDGFLVDGTTLPRLPNLTWQFEATSLVDAATSDAIGAVIDRLRRASNAPLRILVTEPHCRSLLSLLNARVRHDGDLVTIVGSEKARLERLVARLSADSGIEVIEIDDELRRARPRFDIAISIAFRRDHCADPLTDAARLVVDGGPIVVVRPPARPLLDFWFGTTPDWFAESVDPTLPVGAAMGDQEVRRLLERAGLRSAKEYVLDDDGTTVFVGRVPVRTDERPLEAPRVHVSATAPGAEAFIADFAEVLTARGGGIVDGPTADGIRVDRLFIVPHGEGDDLVRTLAAIEALRIAITEAPISEPHPRLRVVVRSGVDPALDPVAEAVRTFARVVLNEHPDSDLRLLDLDPTLDDETAVSALVDWLTDVDDEREVSIRPDGVFVPRVTHGIPLVRDESRDPDALEMTLPRRGALEHFMWRPKPRRRPGADEIEVEVVATGLNFRDVMLALGLLDDADLADGMAGPVYGFECSGRVVAIGEEVTTHAVGDVVFGFASGAFATHVTAPAGVFVGLPAGLDAASAASIPVTFLTAWYGLVECARLKPGETVLVHGAAGGVGIAAIQVARAIGARVVATVSTTEKRALVSLLGAEAVYDSRSLDFADDLRVDFDGVDVVLNSLSGDAMRASVKCLKPFGRFIELGKRDYVGNTELALRPFRRNLTYYGVDVDQLLAYDPSIVARGFEELAAGFADGRYTPLPHRIYDADAVGDAFRLMQAAGHVGKILVRPPSLSERRSTAGSAAPFRPADGVHLVVGGTGGFGFATARWLAETGADRIIVASRSGRVDETASAIMAALRADGVDFRVETVDATDEASVEALVARCSAAMGPIVGVWFTAMVLDDGLLTDLDETRIARVLAPKIAGATHLDRATRSQPIEQFVMFSSATTLIGSPGQGAYVAANGWLEGLARRRRAEGMPALTVAWGSIVDVGVLARDTETAKRLERVTGVAGFRSADALFRLGELVSRGSGLADPVVCCARFVRGGAMHQLAVLRGPAFVNLVKGGDQDEGETDLALLIEGKSDTDALKILGQVIAGEVARILRLSTSEVDLGRPLDELGLDSLMALELRMNVENRFNVQLPLVAITSVKNLHELSRRLLQSLRSGNSSDETRIDASDRSLIAIHGGDEEAFAGLAADIEALRERRE